MFSKRYKYNEFHRINEDGLEEKLCYECNQWLIMNNDNFGLDKGNKDKFNSRCRTCQRKKNKEYYLENQDKLKEDSKRRKRANREKCLEIDKAYNQANKEKRHDKIVAYRRTHVEKRMDYQRDWLGREESKPKIKIYSKNLEHKKHQISKREWLSCKEYFKDEDGDCCCAYCGLKLQNHFKRYRGEMKHQDFHREHIDHNGSRGLDNCVPSCGMCNSLKHDFKLEDWYNEKNPLFSQERLDKLNKWRYEDYKNI